MKLVNFASLDPAIVSTGRVGLKNASRLDRAIYYEFQSNWQQCTAECINMLQSKGFKAQMEELTADRTVRATKEQKAYNDDDIHADYSGKTVESTVAVRVGQAFFRQSVLASYSFTCCMSGVSLPELLTASHIIPWSRDIENRLNPRNGLCLSAIHDRAFDRGLITVTPQFEIKVSGIILNGNANNPSSQMKLLARLDGRKITFPDKFMPDRGFLEWHNRNIFTGGAV